MSFLKNEKYYVFDPASAETQTGNPGRLHQEHFTDWAAYRSSQQMVKEGLSLLNQYFYDRMYTKPIVANNYNDKPVTDKQLHLFLKIIECFAGLFGWRPTMEPYIPDEMRHLFLRRMNEYSERNHDLSATEIRRKNRLQEEDYANWQKAHPNPMPNYPRDKYWKDLPIPGLDLEKIIEEHKPQGMLLHEIPRSPRLADVWEIQNNAIAIGFTQAELENLIQWRIRPLQVLEEKPLVELVKIVANIHVENEIYERESPRVYRSYTAIMSHDLMQAKFGDKQSELPFETVEPYMRTVAERIAWQMTELQHFIVLVLSTCPMALERDPVLIPSTKYDETPKREKTQAEMIDTMAQELTNLPRFTAYTKVIEEQGGKQAVYKGKVEIPKLDKSDELEKDNDLQFITSRLKVLEKFADYVQKREWIEEEIRSRQEQWRRGGGSDDSPPTHSGGHEPLLPSGASVPEPEEPPPTHYTPAKIPDLSSKPTPTLQLESLKFFESGYENLGREQCQYNTLFPQSTTRFINFDLSVSRLPKDCNLTYQLEARYYSPDGSLMGTRHLNDFGASSLESLNYACGKGWREPGNWMLGTYRVEILIDGVKFAEGSFTIE